MISAETFIGTLLQPGAADEKEKDQQLNLNQFSCALEHRQNNRGSFCSGTSMLRLSFLGEVFESFFDFLAQLRNIEGLGDKIERAKIHSLGG